MADFSSSDINEARRRVQEMRKKAREYTDLPPSDTEKADTNFTKETKSQNNDNNFISTDILSKLMSGDDNALILALILILSKEKADNMLILALLYILL